MNLWIVMGFLLEEVKILRKMGWTSLPPKHDHCAKCKITRFGKKSWDGDWRSREGTCVHSEQLRPGLRGPRTVATQRIWVHISELSTDEYVYAYTIRLFSLFPSSLPFAPFCSDPGLFPQEGKEKEAKQTVTEWWSVPHSTASELIQDPFKYSLSA